MQLWILLPHDLRRKAEVDGLVELVCLLLSVQRKRTSCYFRDSMVKFTYAGVDLPYNEGSALNILFRKEQVRLCRKF